MFVAIINDPTNPNLSMIANTSALPVPVIISTSLPANDTNKQTSSKINCAKECPCGVPVIPVPDQWLEVMVSGGFKVWHIIFIIIALIVTMVVVYCCFHRCRIPRTKQEIEADLMRSNMTNKFRDYLQELPNEPVTFIEVLKRVVDMEEKLEKDDAVQSRDVGMRKRMGWLKLKGKNSPPQQNEDIEAGQPGEASASALDKNGIGPDPQVESSKVQDQSKPSATSTELPEPPNKQPLIVNEATNPAGELLNPSALKSNLDVQAATKLAKEQHRAKRDLRKKKSPRIASADVIEVVDQTKVVENISPSQSPSNDKQHTVRKRKHNKANLSRSKMIREKTHPSFDTSAGASLANGHSHEKLNVSLPIHEQTQVTFEEPIDLSSSPTKSKDKKKTKTKKQQITTSPKTTKSPKKVVRERSIKSKDL